MVARESAQYTKVQSLVHTLERDEKKRFSSLSSVHISDSILALALHPIVNTSTIMYF